MGDAMVNTVRNVPESMDEREKGPESRLGGRRLVLEDQRIGVPISLLSLSAARLLRACGARISPLSFCSWEPREAALTDTRAHRPFSCLKSPFSTIVVEANG